MSAKAESLAKRKNRTVIIGLIVLFLFVILGIVWWYWQQPDVATSAEPISENSSMPISADDSDWVPDAVIESDDKILEMKFGN